MNGRLEQAVRQVVARRTVPAHATATALGETPNSSQGRIARLRERHHAIARMVAVGMPDEQICKVSGITIHTLDILKNNTPAFLQLVFEFKNSEAGRKNIALMEEANDLMERLFLTSLHNVADRISDDPDSVSIANYTKIISDLGDRIGYSKHSVSLHIHGTLADRLEARRRRNSSPAGAGVGGGVSSPLSGSAPPLLDLKAEPPAQSHSPVSELTVPGQVAQPQSNRAAFDAMVMAGRDRRVIPAVKEPPRRPK